MDLPRGSQGWNLGGQAWCQASLPAQSPCLFLFSFALLDKQFHFMAYKKARAHLLKDRSESIIVLSKLTKLKG